MPQKNLNCLCQVIGKKRESHNVVTIKLMPKNGCIFPFVPGQFTTVYFTAGPLSGVGKPYTISSLPNKDYIAITVKKVGNFSGALHKLKKGDELLVKGSYGNLYPGEDINNLVFIAGGCGIIPFYMIAQDCFKKMPDKKQITLFYSNKTENDIIYHAELKEIVEKWKNFKAFFYLTQQESSDTPGFNFGRMNVPDIKKRLGNLKKQDYFICGTIGFVKDFWEQLKNAGVDEDNIYIETFF